MTMMDAQTKEGVLIGQIESLLRVRYYLPPEREVYALKFKGFGGWCEQQGLRALPASGHVAAAYLLDLHFGGASLDEIETAGKAILYAHEMAQQFIDDAPMRAAVVFAMQKVAE
jgi:hypothetical protein